MSALPAEGGSAPPGDDELFNPSTEGELEQGAVSIERARALSQMWIGQLAAFSVFASLILVVVMAFTLAILGRDAEYIKSVLEGLQPFLLPAIAAIVGYGIGRRDSGNAV
jgi:hypothetical protein